MPLPVPIPDGIYPPELFIRRSSRTSIPTKRLRRASTKEVLNAIENGDDIEGIESTLALRAEGPI